MPARSCLWGVDQVQPPLDALQARRDLASSAATSANFRCTRAISLCRVSMRRARFDCPDLMSWMSPRIARRCSNTRLSGSSAMTRPPSGVPGSSSPQIPPATFRKDFQGPASTAPPWRSARTAVGSTASPTSRHGLDLPRSLDGVGHPPSNRSIAGLTGAENSGVDVTAYPRKSPDGTRGCRRAARSTPPDGGRDGPRSSRRGGRCHELGLDLGAGERRRGPAAQVRLAFLDTRPSPGARGHGRYSGG